MFLFLYYIIKQNVDLCFGKHKSLLNSKLVHIDLRFKLFNMKFFHSITLHVHLNISQYLYFIIYFIYNTDLVSSEGDYII